VATDGRSRGGPLVYFEFVTYYGGNVTGTVNLIRVLKDTTAVRVIDVYGTCGAYLRDLQALGIPATVLLPTYRGETTIGTGNLSRRASKMISGVPHILGVARRLRRSLLEIRPRGLWVDQEKSLFVAWLAAPPELPIVVYRRGEIKRILPYCAAAWRRADGVLGVSESCLDYLRSTHYGHGKFRTLYDGVDVDDVRRAAASTPRPLPGRSPDALRVVLPAHLRDGLKGHETAVRAVARLIATGGAVQLLLCGSVPPGSSPTFAENLHRLAQELGVDRDVHFLGYREDVAAVMAAADVVLLPSWTEGLPRSLMEAMALGKPVVATPVGGIPELVRQGIDGLLVSPGDVNGLVSALRELRGPETRVRMGRAGQERVRERFTTTNQATGFLEFLEARAHDRDAWLHRGTLIQKTDGHAQRPGATQ
jgi:glycosyltransferase involved in cell wall biosynthesis